LQDLTSEFEVAFLGATGSCSYNNGNRTRIGANSICVAVRCGGETLIFDCGSGIGGFGGLAEFQSDHAHLFFSHYHTDHVCGLLFFPAFFDKQKKFDIYGPRCGESDCREIIDSYLSPPLHPVGLREFGAEMRFHTVEEGDILRVSDSVTVRTYGLSHPGGAIGYRVECGDKSFCYCTDIELANHKGDDSLLTFMRNSDLLVIDSFFDDGKVIPGWGHSSWRECAAWAKRAEVKQLALFHHSFAYTDADIAAMAEKAREIFPSTIAAADFMRVRL
jgi:phosphoribosyl 1,2-cyclic phosphodiesterase